MGDKMANIVKVIYTLGKADFESFGGLKVGTSLAKAGNYHLLLQLFSIQLF